MSAPIDQLNAALAGRYRIERELGAGGMATVYLAHDERHDRKVALKVLKPELAAVIGAERFLNEIKTTANLQHPHILPLHDSGEVGGTVWYVMPLVEGESLRERLQRETQLPIDDALKIALDVAGALDYAHRHGVIHRDIKPENILLHDGRAVVADFGIALAMSRTEGGTRLTETGMSLGTPHYMSPEQALGERTVDARTDEYALGAVLYEMLVGEPPFTGPSAQAIVAKVMSAAPASIVAVRPTVPLAVEAAVLRALAKLPADRFRSAADFAAALQAGATGWSGAMGAAQTSGQTAQAQPLGSARMAAGALLFVPWIVAAVAVIVATFFAMRGHTAVAERVTASVVPLELRTPTDLPLNEVGPPISIAPDGSFLVFVGPDPETPGSTALWIRQLDRLNATAIPGTRGAQRPIVAYDAKSVQYFTRAPSRNGNMRWEVGFDGALPQERNQVGGLRRLRDGSALVLVDSAFIRVRAGQPLPQSTRPPDATAGRLVFDVSPDGRFLAVARRGAGLRDSITMRTIDGNRAGSVAEGVSPTFIDNDLLAFRATDGTLQVGRLNRERSQFVAPPTSLLPNVSLSGDGNAVYAIAYDGTLVYTQGGAASQSRPVWVGGGREQPIPNAESRVYGGAALSPNGRRAAITYGGLTGGGDIWISDLAQGSLSPLTSDGRSTRPSWTRDGKNVTYLHSLIGLGFAIDSGNRSRVFQRGADGAAPADTLPGPWPNDGVDELEWSPDGRYAAIRTRHGSGPGRAANRDIVIRRVGSDSTIPFATEAAQERGPRFSPDGKWLLYVSDRSGRDEVYAESFPGGGNRVQLSADGAREGIWSRDGSQVFYRAPDGWMISAHLSRGSALAVAKRDRLFDASPYLSNQFLAMYDVAPDGRFLMFKLDARPERTDVVLIRNWVQQVRARLAQAKP